MKLYNKYLKYKAKYINLQGGSKITAKNFFVKNITNNNSLLNILINDITIKEQVTTYFSTLFDNIYKEIFNDNEKNIDWIIKSYLNNTFGSPSSFENVGRYKESYEKYTKLKNKFKEDIIDINNINGLVALEEYVDS